MASPPPPTDGARGKERRARARKIRNRRIRRGIGDAAIDWRRRIATLAGGLALGLVALVFAQVADKVQRLFLHVIAPSHWIALAMVPCLFAATAWATARWWPEARGSGIPQIIAASRRPDELAAGPLVSLRTAAAKFVLTLAMLFGGASVGREGPTVQITAAINVAVHRWLGVAITPGVLIAGGAAGVAAAFNTPLAGVAFAIEELAAAYEQRLAVLVMGTVMIAGFVSLGIQGDYIYLGAMHQHIALGTAIVAVPVAGVAGGACGGLFSRALLFLSAPGRSWPHRLRAHPVPFALLCGLVVAVAGIGSGGLTWGTGYEPSKLLVEGARLDWWYGPAKFAATLATAVSGAPGGIFAPSLSVGAGVGNILAPLFDAPPGTIVLLGMIAYFAGAVRAPLTAVIIISEATDSRIMIIPLFAAAIIADFVSARVHQERLYHGLSHAFMGPPAEADRPS